QNSPKIDPDADLNFWKQILPNDFDDDPSKVKTDTDPQYAGEQKNAARQVSCAGTESNLQKLVDTLNSVSIVRTNESECDDDAGQNGPDRQLGIDKAPRFESFSGRTEKCRGTCLCGNN